jgi:alginate O-acetyltransferase complex protein AlgI
MFFYEPLFLFLFAPAVYLLYELARARADWRGLVLLGASFIFYAWSEPVFIWVACGSIAVDLVVARKIARADPAPLEKKLWLAFGVCANLAVLAYYKYAGFLVQNLDALLPSALALAIPKIALPVGVSFIVFEKITYLVDVYRGVTPPARSLRLYALYVLFFPKLLAGPIIKYHDIAGQFERPPEGRLDDFAEGFSRFMQGVVKKVLLADALAGGADLVFARDPSELGFLDAWAGVIFFTFQIYFDFSGYSDMAIGLARLFGFRLLENFDSPYVATTMTEFWRRWHMSLTSWIREYLYFPLGGNRAGAWRTNLNLWLCFIASGVWHGAAWTFIAWGAYNGAFLALDRIFLAKSLKRLPPIVANLVTFIIVMVGWTIFRAASLGQAAGLLGVMAQPLKPSPEDAVFPSYCWIAAVIGAAIVVAQRAELSIVGLDWEALARRHAFAANMLLALLFAAALAKALADPFKPFIYFRF